MHNPHHTLPFQEAKYSKGVRKALISLKLYGYIAAHINSWKPFLLLQHSGRLFPLPQLFFSGKITDQVWKSTARTIFFKKIIKIYYEPE